MMRAPIPRKATTPKRPQPPPKVRTVLGLKALMRLQVSPKPSANLISRSFLHSLHRRCISLAVSTAHCRLTASCW